MSVRIPSDKELDGWSLQKLIAGKSVAVKKLSDANRARRDADFDVDNANGVIQALARALARRARK